MENNRHKYDPCIFCRTPHDNVELGSCKARFCPICNRSFKIDLGLGLAECEECKYYWDYKHYSYELLADSIHFMIAAQNYMDEFIFTEQTKAVNQIEQGILNG